MDVLEKKRSSRKNIRKRRRAKSNFTNLCSMPFTNHNWCWRSAQRTISAIKIFVAMTKCAVARSVAQTTVAKLQVRKAHFCSAFEVLLPVVARKWLDIGHVSKTSDARREAQRSRGIHQTTTKMNVRSISLTRSFLFDQLNSKIISKTT